MTNPVGLDDSGASPEAQAAMAAARLVVPNFPLTPAECLHNHDQVVEVGKGFEDETHVMTVHRCLECGSEFVTKENQ